MCGAKVDSGSDQIITRFNLLLAVALILFSCSLIIVEEKEKEAKGNDPPVCADSFSKRESHTQRNAETSSVTTTEHPLHRHSDACHSLQSSALHTHRHMHLHY